MAHYFKLGAYDEVSWHALEDRLTHNNIWQAMQETGMAGIEFGKFQSYTLWNGQFLPVDGKFQLVMVGAPWADGTAIPFGRQVTSYEPLQHRFMADLLQPVIDKSNGNIKLKGVAVIGPQGEISFVQLDLGSFWVADHPDEEHSSLVLLADNKTAGSTHWLHTPTRVVCANTYAMAVDNAPPIPHSADGKLFLAFHVAMLERALRLKDEEKARMDAFWNAAATPERIQVAIDKIFPDPKPTPAQREAAKVKGNPTDPRIVAMLERAEADTNRLASQFELARTRRQAVSEAVTAFNDERPEAANTAYAFFQGVTNVVTHSDTFTGDPWKQTISQLFGGQKASMIETAVQEASLMVRGK